jgi:hypothetical protein
MHDNGQTGFVGTAGPGAVIDQYLPQPGQHVGRRIIRIADTPENYWLGAATAAGIPWPIKLGLEKDNEGLWDVRSPESFISTWFSRRAKLRPTPVALGTRGAERQVTARS